MSDRNLNVLNVPISNDGTTMRNVVLYVPIPLTPAEWDQFHDVLEAMRPALVDYNTNEGNDNEQDPVRA